MILCRERRPALWVMALYITRFRTTRRSAHETLRMLTCARGGCIPCADPVSILLRMVRGEATSVGSSYY